MCNASMGRLDFRRFRKQFDAKVRELNPTWQAVGFLTPDDKVYAFGTDSKVISTVFEGLVAPIVHDIAETHGYAVEGSNQTVYPDFTLSVAGGTPPRIAIDVKTTYRRFNAGGGVRPFSFTLGSYTSYLRSTTEKKNIAYPYHEYSDHWVIGFLYTRREGVPAKVYRRSELPTLLCPYLDVEYFVQEKYKIVGIKPGSGNTANIGSFATTEIDDLRAGRGPFAKYGKDFCDAYWRHYGRTKADRPYASITEFEAWTAAQSESR